MAAYNKKERMDAMNCNKSGCGSCCGSCGSCVGREMFLTEPELKILELLGEVAFLPAARRADTMEPHCREEGLPPEANLALEALERKRLISLDWDKPLRNFDYSGYKGLPVHGSAALTALGQSVLEIIALQGVGEE